MKPTIIAFDFEATSLNYWEPDFRVVSAAFAWMLNDGSIKTRYLTDEDEIKRQIEFIQQAGIQLVAHNASFELGVCLYRLGIDAINLLDTMRLVQVYDNGGKDVQLSGPMSLEDELAALTGELKVKTGLGLESAVTRLLPKDLHDHKQPYYKWLRENAGVKKGQEGANLHLLPDNMFESYNTMDAILTLMLYNRITAEFKDKYDWTYDHKLHMDACERIVRAKARGIKVDRDFLTTNRNLVVKECQAIEQGFIDKYQREIYYLEQGRWEDWICQPKTERGRAQRQAKGIPDNIRFNPGSTKQLSELFIDKLGMQPTFFTKESKASKKLRETNPDKEPFVPQPSMRAAHLPSYGEGGAMLQNLKKRKLVNLQQDKLLELSAKDGYWHHDLKACGTKTGRYAGGGGLNVQGLARREKGLMGCFIPEEGYTFVSIDLASGEPTCTAHYSGDKNYRALTFDLVGKEPEWKNGILMLDDPYLAFASVSPLGQTAVKDAWDAGLFKQWMSDSESVKKHLKKVRAVHKTFFLALAYGQGPRGMVNFSADQGFALDLKDAKAIHSNFWNVLFPDVHRLSERLKIQYKRQGFLVNELGYRMQPEHERLCFNMLIQSTVSGMMKVFENLLFKEAPYALYVSTIHDEVLVQVPDDRLGHFRKAAETATKQLNDFLKWNVEVRTGFVPGKDLYAAK